MTTSCVTGSSSRPSPPAALVSPASASSRGSAAGFSRTGAASSSSGRGAAICLAACWRGKPRERYISWRGGEGELTGCAGASARLVVSMRLVSALFAGAFLPNASGSPVSSSIAAVRVRSESDEGREDLARANLSDCTQLALCASTARFSARTYAPVPPSNPKRSSSPPLPPHRNPS